MPAAAERATHQIHIDIMFASQRQPKPPVSKLRQKPRDLRRADLHRHIDKIFRLAHRRAEIRCVAEPQEAQRNLLHAAAGDRAPALGAQRRYLRSTTEELYDAIKNGIKRGELRQCLLDSARLTVMIFTVIWGVLIFVRFLGFSGMPEEVSKWVGDLKVAPIFVLLAIYLLYFVLGTVLEGIGMFLLTLPVIFPVIQALGYDPIWFGIVLVKLSGIASLSPPVGLVVFVVNGVRPDISVRDIFKGIWPFIFADTITLAILTAFPEIVTFIVEVSD